MYYREILLFLALLPMQSVLAKETIVTKGLSESEYELRLMSDHELAVDEAQAHLAETASNTCGSRPASLGRYSFESSAPVDSAKRSESTHYVFIQHVSCTAPEPSPSTSPTPQLSDADRTSLEIEVRALTNSYLSDLAAQQYSTAYAYLSAEMQAMQPRQEWEKERRNLHKAVGERVSGGISRVTIYVDPPSAPRPGIYVATDY